MLKTDLELSEISDIFSMKGQEMIIHRLSQDVLDPAWKQFSQTVGWISSGSHVSKGQNKKMVKDFQSIPKSLDLKMAQLGVVCEQIKQSSK